MRIQPDLPGVDFADALDQQVRRGLLEDDSGRPQLHRLHELVLVVRGRQHDDPRAVLHGLQPLQGRETVQARHLEVQQQDVRFELLQYVQNLPPILSLSHHLKILFQAQQLAQPVAEDGMVVRHHDPNLGRVVAGS
jgi:hypothetical protein